MLYFQRARALVHWGNAMPGDDRSQCAIPQTLVSRQATRFGVRQAWGKSSADCITFASSAPGRANIRHRKSTEPGRGDVTGNCLTALTSFPVVG